ncbi:hypothetical protein LCGC14_1076950 [marine sediment metagenome]|uniref:DUF4031 domain-containing protein n=1 Tax=marine sediment metagenome TaxID=412755 RepID=A0A0F9QMA6_9ZZZZ
MILTDGVHLVSDTSLAELHKFAQSMGLERHWFQVHREHPHYDLTTLDAYRRALRHGAVKVTARELAKCMIRQQGEYNYERKAQDC